MFVFSTLVALAVLGASTGQDTPICAPQMKDGARVIFQRHCPNLKDISFDDYVKCLTKKGLKIEAALKTCADRLKIDFTPMALCNPNAADDSINNICCAITQELKSTNMTGCDKVDYSRSCVDELLAKKG